MSDMFLLDVTRQLQSEPNRKGFGRGLKKAGELDERVVALCADLTESTQMSLFRDAFPERFFEVGIAEQNLARAGGRRAQAVESDALVAKIGAHANQVPFVGKGVNQRELPEETADGGVTSGESSGSCACWRCRPQGGCRAAPAPPYRWSPGTDETRVPGGADETRR